MSEHTTSAWGEAYQAIPIVEPWGDAGWKAGVLLSAGEARARRERRRHAVRLGELAQRRGVARRGRGADAVARDADFVVAHVRLGGGHDDALVAGDAGHDRVLHAQVAQQEIERGRIERR